MQAFYFMNALTRNATDSSQLYESKLSKAVTSQRRSAHKNTQVVGLFHCSVIKGKYIENLTGDDAHSGNTRSHPEHDG